MQENIVEYVLRVFCKRIGFGQFCHNESVLVIGSNIVIYMCYSCYDQDLNRRLKEFEVINERKFMR